jgi:hypothetical protein
MVIKLCAEKTFQTRGPFRVRRGNSKMRCGDHWFQEPQDAPDG